MSGWNKRRFLLASICPIAATWLAPCSSVWAHGNEHHARKPGPVIKEQKDWGIAGEARSARHTVQIKMGDDMRFTPDRLDVTLGEAL